MTWRRRGGRNSRSLQSFARPPGTRAPKKRILIVCEGAKTEPLYFDHFRIERRLSTELIKIVSGDDAGSHPKNVVQCAKKLRREARSNRFDFDQVWCVFDRDRHEKIDEAFNQARANRFEIAFSNPSFELWYLLHFQDQGGAIEREQTLRKLKGHIPNYDKARDVYDALRDKQADAIRRAVELRRQHQGHTGVPPNPYTRVDVLVVFLNRFDSG